MTDGEAGPRQKSILVVDDDADVRRGLAMLLGGEYEVREAADGESCLRAVAQACPNLVLLDVAMPGMTGIEVLRQMRSRCPNTPVLMLTAQTDIGLAKQALDLGATAISPNPSISANCAWKCGASLQDPPRKTAAKVTVLGA